ncbi:50S ribosomal protein L4 [Myxococcota bacterium]|nr:50S ribosomal protein L4 [Myxococcota bacterium]
MPVFEVFNTEGKKVDEISLSSEIFGGEVNQHVLWLVVKAQLAARRAGTHKTKTRREVAGGGRKPFKQKGTGGARQGSRRAPHYVGGGVAFGTSPRSYVQGVNKKVRRVGLISALSLRASEKKIVLLDDLNLGEVKTKKMASLVEKFGAKKALVVEAKENTNVVLSTRNLAKHKWLPPEAVNVYDILNHDTLIMQASTAKAIEERLTKSVR